MGKNKSTNVTLERLAGLPFKSASALKAAQDEVRLRVWRRLEEARAMNELTQREEFGFWNDELRAGLGCGFADDPEKLVEVSSNGRGINVSINRSRTNDGNQIFIGTLVRSLSDAFAATYYRMKGIHHTEGREEPPAGRPKKRPE